MKSLGLFLWASAAPATPPAPARQTARHSFWSGPGDASPGDYNRLDCAARVAFSILGQGLPLQAPGICGLRVRRPPPTHGLGATLTAGHPWHRLIQQGGQKAPNTTTGCPNICRPSPSKKPRAWPVQRPGSFSWQSRRILEATGHGAELLCGPGPLPTAGIRPASGLER